MAETWKHNHNPVVLNRFDSNAPHCPQQYLKVVLIRNPYLVYLLDKVIKDKIKDKIFLQFLRAKMF